MNIRGRSPFLLQEETHASKDGGFLQAQPRHPTPAERERGGEGPSDGEVDDGTPASRRRPVLRETPNGGREREIERKREKVEGIQ